MKLSIIVLVLTIFCSQIFGETFSTDGLNIKRGSDRFFGIGTHITHWPDSVTDSVFTSLSEVYNVIWFPYGDLVNHKGLIHL